jgi:hypothetical protein
MKYQDFIKTKKTTIENCGFNPGKFHDLLFQFQKDISSWSIKKGKSAIWAGCGLGKTFMQISWAKQVADYTKRPVLILAPLAVSTQTIKEGKKINIDISLANDGIIRINNYEQIHNIDCSIFAGIVLDESSILKNFAGKFKNKIIEAFHDTPYKLCCSATPSPNDFTEIGNHAEFLNICSRSEMLSAYFVHDSGETQKWRLKGHAEKAFFEWLSTWAVMLEKPSNLGYPDDGFILPRLNIYQHTVKAKTDNMSLFPAPARTMNERRQARKESLEDRCKLAAELSSKSDDPWLYWCDLNDEGRLLSELVENSVEVKGSDKSEIKERYMIGFSKGTYQKLITKPKIAQFGMNWQHCNNMVFVGLSDSFEAMYQSIRRCWRFGQTRPVNVHIIISEKEGNVLANIQDKDAKAKKMLNLMILCMNDLSKAEINNTSNQKNKYITNKKMELPEWMSSINNLAKAG